MKRVLEQLTVALCAAVLLLLIALVGRTIGAVFGLWSLL